MNEERYYEFKSRHAKEIEELRKAILSEGEGVPIDVLDISDFGWDTRLLERLANDLGYEAEFVSCCQSYTPYVSFRKLPVIERHGDIDDDARRDAELLWGVGP